MLGVCLKEASCTGFLCCFSLLIYSRALNTALVKRLDDFFLVNRQNHFLQRVCCAALLERTYCWFQFVLLHSFCTSNWAAGLTMPWFEEMTPVAMESRTCVREALCSVLCSEGAEKGWSCFYSCVSDRALTPHSACFLAAFRDDGFQCCSSSHWRRKLFKRAVLLFRNKQAAFMNTGKTKTCNVSLF